MIPVNKPRRGRPKGGKTALAGVGKFGITLSKVLYEKLGKPGYLETYVDGADLVCFPREVGGTNHCKRYNICSSDRAYYYNPTVIELCNAGKYVFSINQSGTLSIKNCVKVHEDVSTAARGPGRPKKSLVERRLTVSNRAENKRRHSLPD
jgi:hypothetical protein